MGEPDAKGQTSREDVKAIQKELSELKSAVELLRASIEYTGLRVVPVQVAVGAVVFTALWLSWVSLFLLLRAPWTWPQVLGIAAVGVLWVVVVYRIARFLDGRPR